METMLIGLPCWAGYGAKADDVRQKINRFSPSLCFSLAERQSFLCLAMRCARLFLWELLTVSIPAVGAVGVGGGGAVWRKVDGKRCLVGLLC